jgi:hydrogenase maturation protease
MRGEVAPARCKLLVIGYGNTLRSDDGAGVRVAEVIAARGLPGVVALAVHQLTPEVAERLAGAERAIFVDARLAEQGRDIAVTRLDSSSSVRPAGHTNDPRALLALAQSVYGHTPQSWLITVPAVDLSLGENLSATAARGVEAAHERVLRMIEAV